MKLLRSGGARWYTMVGMLNGGGKQKSEAGLEGRCAWIRRLPGSAEFGTHPYRAHVQESGEQRDDEREEPLRAEE
jgi:hypothetical protein